MVCAGHIMHNICFQTHPKVLGLQRPHYYLGGGVGVQQLAPCCQSTGSCPVHSPPPPIHWGSRSGIIFSSCEFLQDPGREPGEMWRRRKEGEATPSHWTLRLTKVIWHLGPMKFWHPLSDKIILSISHDMTWKIIVMAREEAQWAINNWKISLKEICFLFEKRSLNVLGWPFSHPPCSLVRVLVPKPATTSFLPLYPGSGEACSSCGNPTWGRGHTHSWR